jgi:hypothetical protein
MPHKKRTILNDFSIAKSLGNNNGIKWHSNGMFGLVNQPILDGVMHHESI